MYIDLNLEVKTNAEFRYKINKLTTEIAKLEKSEDPLSYTKIDERVIEIYRICKYNAGLLLPYFFPQYPNDKPFSCRARPYAYAMFHMQIGGYTCFRASRQIGKELPDYELVLTPKGWRPMGAIRLEEQVFDCRGEVTTVTGVFPQGVKKIHTLVFDDGSRVDCGEEHLWVCKIGSAKKWQVKTFKEIKEAFEDKKDVIIPLCKPIQFSEKTHVIPPHARGKYSGTHQDIPIYNDYIYDSECNRVQLLLGFLEGCHAFYNVDGKLILHIKNYELAHQVRELVESLGGKATVSKSRKQKGVYALRLKLHKDFPGRELIPGARMGGDLQDTARKLVKIKAARKHRATCITVASKTQTFITRHSIVTHNSSSLAARQLIYSHIVPRHRSLYIVPHQSFLDTYANRLREMERAFRFYQPFKDFRQNLKYKEYPNGSVTMLVKCLTDTQEARSKTCSEALFDECQLLDPEFIPDIEQCQKSSERPSTIYAGTSTTMESLLETKYLDSSQSAWFLRAPGYMSASAGAGWINCGDKDDVLKCIRPQGLTNPATGRIIDVTDGHFVHRERDAFEQGYVGFHIPQIIIPDYANKPQKWMEIWNAYENYDQKKFLQEILGIPTEEGMRELSLQDIKNICILPETPETLKQIAQQPNGRYKYVIGGCDWGGSDYNPATKTKASFTVHVIIGVTWDGLIDILHIRQYAGMDYRAVANAICEDHKAFNCIGVASDYGVGAAYNMLLRENPSVRAERHFIFNYTGPQASMVKVPASGGWFNQYALNRTDSITTLYQAIRDRRIRCYHWDLASERLLELLNLFRVPVELPGGGALFKYQKHGSKADDTLHALNFAFCLARIALNEPLLEDPVLRQSIFNEFNPGQAPQFFNPHGGWDMGGVISG